MSYQPRLKKEYNERIAASLKDEFGYKSIMQVPKLEKIVLSRGVGAAVADKKLIDHAVEELTQITGQKAIPTYSKKAEPLKSCRLNTYLCQIVSDDHMKALCKVVC